MTRDGSYRPSHEPKPLTPRQLEVMAAIAVTGSQKDAAASLGISVHTVKRHADIVYERLDVSSYVEVWRALGWLRVPGEAA